MRTKNGSCLGMAVVALVFALFAWLSQPIQASAAAVKEGANSCVGCHEDLYYLHDTGSLYCLTAHTDRCAGCHEGDPVALKKEDAHAGLLAHPQENQGAKCRECHSAQETRERISEFATKSGGFDTVIGSPAYTPSVPVATGFPVMAEVNPLAQNWPWLLGASLFFGLWLFLVLNSPSKP